LPSGEHGNVLIHRAGPVARAHATAIHGKAGQPLLEFQARRRKVGHGAAHHFHHLVQEPGRVATDYLALRIVQGIGRLQQVSGDRPAVRVRGRQDEPFARHPVALPDALRDVVGHLARKAQNFGRDKDGR